MKKLMIALLLLGLGFGSCSSRKYCAGGKKKYKQMKRDTTMMVF
ncbi:MAG: hypothetical protein NT150_07915 [Bacteroidetes bacterium]|nr:hypothetical protein [Bacteroidota bacterium]